MSSAAKLSSSQQNSEFEICCGVHHHPSASWSATPVLKFRLRIVILWDRLLSVAASCWGAVRPGAAKANLHRADGDTGYFTRSHFATLRRTVGGSPPPPSALRPSLNAAIIGASFLSFARDALPLFDVATGKAPSLNPPPLAFPSARVRSAESEPPHPSASFEFRGSAPHRF